VTFLEEVSNVALITKLSALMALVLLMTPSLVSADQLLLMYNSVIRPPVLEADRQTIKRPVDMSLNENGDLVIRRGDVSLTVAYSPPDEVIEPQERIRIAQRQNCPSMSGISLKVSFLF